MSVPGTKLSSAPNPVFESRHTSNNCDPIIFGSTDISDNDFSSLFATDYTPGDDLPFFKDGFAAGNPFDDNTNSKDNILHGDAFTFDSMVDLDAGSSNTNDTSDYTTHHETDDYLNGSLFENVDPSTQDAATSSAQQPLLGAPA